MAHNPTADDIKRDARSAANEAHGDLKDGARKIADDVRDTAR